jgi:hypothetical protein
MSILRVVFLVGLALTLLTLSPTSRAQFAAVGGLDCNGYSKVQKPLRAVDVCTDPRGLWGGTLLRQRSLHWT